MDPSQLLAVITVVAIGYVAFHQYLRHHRRIMIHRERITALEKGVELPVVEQEVQRGGWNVQRVLLLAGLSWISVGLAVFGLLSALSTQGAIQIPWDEGWVPVRVPLGAPWIGVALIGIGLSHLIVYFVGSRKGE